MNNKLLLACLGVMTIVLAACGDGLDTSDNTATPQASATSAKTPNLAGTVVGSFGKLEPFENFESAESRGAKRHHR